MNVPNIGVTWQIFFFRGAEPTMGIRNSKLRYLCPASYKTQVVSFFFFLLYIFYVPLFNSIAPQKTVRRLKNIGVGFAAPCTSMLCLWFIIMKVCECNMLIKITCCFIPDVVPIPDLNFPLEYM